MKTKKAKPASKRRRAPIKPPTAIEAVGGAPCGYDGWECDLATIASDNGAPAVIMRFRAPRLVESEAAIFARTHDTLCKILKEAFGIHPSLSHWQARIAARKANGRRAIADGAGAIEQMALAHKWAQVSEGCYAEEQSTAYLRLGVNVAKVLNELVAADYARRASADLANMSREMVQKLVMEARPQAR